MRKWLVVFDSNFPYPVLLGWLSDDWTGDDTVRDLRRIEDWWRKGPMFVVIEDVASRLPYPLFFVCENGSLKIISDYDEIVDLNCEVSGIAKGDQ